jgi:hypothetical protein
VELLSAGVDVRRQQPARAEQRPVGAAADRLAPRLEPDAARRLVRGLGDGRVAIEELLHVAVLLVDRHAHARVRLLRRQLVRQFPQQLLVLRQPRGVEVARDEAQLRVRGRPGETVRVNEAVAPLGGLGRAVAFRQPLEQPRSELDRVDHLPLRRARMHAEPFDADAHLRRGERLVVDPSHLGAVERVAEVGAELVDVEVVDATSHLLVDGEADANRRVLDLRVRDEIGDGAHYFGHACFVVGAEQRGAIRGDDVVSDSCRKDRVLARAQHLVGIPGEHDVAAVPVLDDLRVDLGARLVLARVHMGDQPNGRALGARHRRENVTMLCQLGVVEAELAQLALQQLAEVALLRRARVRRRILVGRRIDTDVTQEPLEDVAL